MTIPGSRPKRRGTFRSSAGSRRTGPNHAGGVPTLLRFLAFILIMGVVMFAAFLTFLRPVLASVVVAFAYDSPGAIAIPLVRDLVKEDLGKSLTTAPSSDATEVAFVVEKGDTRTDIAKKLAEGGFVTDPRAFVFVVIDRKLAPQLKAGTFVIRKNMTPDQLASALLKPADLAIDLVFREGLRLEQIVAKLETTAVTMDVNEFYELAKRPSSALLRAYPWLVLPAGASLEGFLAPATYHVSRDITPEALIRKMLDAFYEQVGPERMAVAKTRGLTFYQVLTLASLVEREVIVDEERVLVAGVYQNRLNPKLWKSGLLQADPTVLYGHDTVALANLTIEEWTQYSFWDPFPDLGLVEFPLALAPYQTYTAKGLPPAPICTPTAASIDAALAPNTKDGYLFFVAKHDGGDGHAFAKTQAEHEANLKKYGYTP